ncbi:hypothetical protein [Meiothermus cerbereus]|uniref:hypothetical protein n=1 Tax=Meiothermus cerbereus TaxID=65552 RepID=UPI003EED45BA
MRYTKHITISPEALQQARAVLEAEGYVAEAPTLDLLERGVILAAYRAADGEGYLLSAAEVRLVAHHGLPALDPDHPDPRPRWERSSTRDRERAYAEAALARAVLEVQSAPVGQRNNVLARAAFGLGQLEHLGLDEHRVLEELVQAALATGLTHQEALSTARRSFERGSREPRDLPPSDLAQSARGSARGFALNKRDGDGQNPFSANSARHQSAFARGKGGKR